MKGVRILVVEDEALIMLATLDMLRELGHDAVAAATGTAALARLGETGFDLLMADINLPDMDGQVLAAEARRLRPGLPVVFATSYRITVTGTLEESGPTAVLSKPYMPCALAAAISGVLAA